MNRINKRPTQANLFEPVRNRYYYGKMMDVHSFTMEQEYMLNMQRMINKTVLGVGVVCGLNVKKAACKNAVYVTPGIAIDHCGRLIVVPQESTPIDLPKALTNSVDSSTEETSRKDFFVHLKLRYCEYESDPTPIFINDCANWGDCEAGAIVEQHDFFFVSGKDEGFKDYLDDECDNIVSGNEINHRRLAEWITDDDCLDRSDCSITLAEMCLEAQEDRIREGSIDITVRPLVYTNKRIFGLLNAMTTPNRRGHR